MSLSSLCLISPDFPWWIFIFITFHTISVNGTIGVLLTSSSGMLTQFVSICLFVSWKYFIQKKSFQYNFENVQNDTWSRDPLSMFFTKKYSLKLYSVLCLTLPVECLSVSLSLSLTPPRIILYSYIRLWEIPWELGIIKDGIYCFIMYIRAKAICICIQYTGYSFSWTYCFRFRFRVVEFVRSIKANNNLVLFLISDYCWHFAWNGAVRLVRKPQG